MSTQSVTLMDGKLHVYRRENSRFWQCSTFLGGRNHRATTKEDEILRAEEFARGWYAERLVDERRRRRGDVAPEQVIALARTDRRRRKPSGPTFRDAAELFMSEFEVITGGQRSPVYVNGHRRRLDLHLLPFFGDMAVADIKSGDITAFRAHRMKTGVARRVQIQLAAERRKNPDASEPEPESLAKPGKSTLHQEIVCLRQVLKTALRKGWIDHLPDLSAPYRGSGKITHRAWFSNDEYTKLWKATGQRAKNPLKQRWRWASEQLHDLVLFAGNSGLRPDELMRLEFRDVTIIDDDFSRKEILLIEVRGKRGIRYCKTMPGAVLPFRRLSERKRPLKVDDDQGVGIGRRAVRSPRQGEAIPGPTDLLFPSTHRQLFNDLLVELDLKQDRDGQDRTLYSLRHYYICQRLMEGAEIYQVAKNCGTSVEMIQKYYASHIANTLLTSAINVRAPRRRKPKNTPAKQTAATKA
jgi:integrase